MCTWLGMAAAALFHVRCMHMNALVALTHCGARSALLVVCSHQHCKEGVHLYLNGSKALHTWSGQCRDSAALPVTAGLVLRKDGWVACSKHLQQVQVLLSSSFELSACQPCSELINTAMKLYRSTQACMLSILLGGGPSSVYMLVVSGKAAGGKPLTPITRWGRSV